MGWGFAEPFISSSSPKKNKKTKKKQKNKKKQKKKPQKAARRSSSCRTTSCARPSPCCARCAPNWAWPSSRRCCTGPRAPSRTTAAGRRGALWFVCFLLFFLCALAARATTNHRLALPLGKKNKGGTPTRTAPPALTPTCVRSASRCPTGSSRCWGSAGRCTSCCARSR